MHTRQPDRIPVANVAATVLLFATLNAAAAQANTSPNQTSKTPKCFGQTATIVGIKGQSTVRGTPGPDVIFSRWDDQHIHGLDGDDRLCGHAGISGGRGDDTMSVRSEKKYLDFSGLDGGRGDDTIYRNEALTDDPHFELPTYGGPGDDVLYGGPNLDLLRGGPGADVIYGGGLSDTVGGGSGADALVGGAGDDHLWGGLGDDNISGSAGTDVAVGDDGVDTCTEVEDEDCELP